MQQQPARQAGISLAAGGPFEPHKLACVAEWQWRWRNRRTPVCALGGISRRCSPPRRKAAPLTHGNGAAGFTTAPQLPAGDHWRRFH